MLEYDAICERILRTERLLLKLKREYETLSGLPDGITNTQGRTSVSPSYVSTAHSVFWRDAEAP